jgi:branched-chain amino acid transport system substrate-binding protein
VNKAFVAAYAKRYNAEPNQFAAQAYDALHIVAATLKDVKLSGDLAADREALKNALPKASISGATGPFKFRPAKTKDGKVGGWDADQKPFIYVVRGGKFTLFEGK